MDPSQRWSAVALAGFVALALRAREVEADCAVPRQALTPAIADGARLGSRSPIVAYMHAHWGPRGPVTPLAIVGPRRIALRERTIAPDVIALEPAELPPAGTYLVEGLVAPLHVEYTADPPPVVAVAPVLTAATHASLGLDRHAGERWLTRATLGAGAPPGVVMVLARWIVGGRVAGASFHPVAAGTSTVVLFETAPGCATNPGGQAAPPAGAQVEIAWLDVAGRTSPWSNRTAVTVATTAPRPTF